jgi:hypothetical protein
MIATIVLAHDAVGVRAVAGGGERPVRDDVVDRRSVVGALRAEPAWGDRHHLGGLGGVAVDEVTELVVDALDQLVVEACARSDGVFGDLLRREAPIMAALTPPRCSVQAIAS